MILERIKQAIKEHKSSIPFGSDSIIEFHPNEKSNFDKEEHLTYMGLPPEKKEETLVFCDKCMDLLKRLNYLKSQRDFSTSFMEMSANYYATMLAENRRMPIKCLKNVVDNLITLQSDKSNYSKYMTPLIQEGEQLITKTLLEYY